MHMQISISSFLISSFYDFILFFSLSLSLFLFLSFSLFFFFGGCYIIPCYIYSKYLSSSSSIHAALVLPMETNSLKSFLYLYQLEHKSPLKRMNNPNAKYGGWVEEIGILALSTRCVMLRSLVFHSALWTKTPAVSLQQATTTFTYRSTTFVSTWGGYSEVLCVSSGFS